ncbi:hypothetical protein QC762_0064960 [Podospora pseudocomata]|uniref:Uncharacterized protein n=1 Tax=Podospora pseudocomata TaxID=2093779 RepID=A0ABR0GF37_9PEZI|nr:hypothetical protein QC762_0064960 [Podospora pseudocomata]
MRQEGLDAQLTAFAPHENRSSFLFPCVIECLIDIHITSPRLTGTVAAQSRLGPWQSFCTAPPLPPTVNTVDTLQLVRKPGIRSGLGAGMN